MSSFEHKESKTNGRWTKAEHERFMLGLELYGKNWKKIQELLGTRTGSQIRSHAQKFFLKVKKTGDAAEQEDVAHDTNDCGQPLSVISKSISETIETGNANSFFMEKIIKANANHFTQDFWNNFIDVKPTKSDADYIPEVRRKDSFVSFEGCDSKIETPISFLNALGEPLV